MKALIAIFIGMISMLLSGYFIGAEPLIMIAQCFGYMTGAIVMYIGMR